MSERIVIPVGVKTCRVPEAGECPGCLRKLTAVSSETGEKPRPGDMSLCVYCGTVCYFEQGLTLREVTEDDLASLRPDQLRSLLLAQRQIKAYAKLATAPNRPPMFAATIPKFKNPPR